MRGLLLAASCLVLPALAIPALAQISAEIPPPSQTAQGEVSVTIYNNNLALVQDRRQLDIPAGRSRQEFPDVSAQIRPETVTLTGRRHRHRRAEFRFRPALPAGADAESGRRDGDDRAHQSRHRRRKRASAPASSPSNGGVVLQIGERIEVLRDDGLPVRVIFDQVPENLRARPTLSVTVQSDARRPPPGHAHLSDARPRLGGRLCRPVRRGDRPDRRAGLDHADQQYRHDLTSTPTPCWSRARSGQASRATMAAAIGRTPPAPMRQAGHRERGARAARRLLSLSAARADDDRQPPDQAGQLPRRRRARRRRAAYEFRNGWLGTSDQPQSANSVLRFSTSREQGLGDALPAGTVRVYQRDARGNPQFVGESAIGHTPMGSELGLTTGQAFDVKVQPIVEAPHADQHDPLAHDDALRRSPTPGRTRSPSI